MKAAALGMEDTTQGHTSQDFLVFIFVTASQQPRGFTLML